MAEQISTWDLTKTLVTIANADKPWLKKLENIAETILRASQHDSIWMLTLPPLEVAAFGLLRNQNDQTIFLSDSLPPISETWPYQHDVLGPILSSGQAMFAPDFNGHQTAIDHDLGDVLFSFDPIHVQAIVPLTAGSITFGFVVVGSYNATHYLDETFRQQLVSAMGQNLALALQNASLIAQEQRHARQITTLTHIAQTITSTLDLDQVIEQTVLHIDEILNVEAGSLLLYDPIDASLYFKIILRGEENIISQQRLRPGEGVAGWVFKNQQALIVNNTRQDPRFASRIDALSGFHTRSVLAAPLIVSGSVIGVLEVLNKRHGHFTLTDQNLLTFMTASLAVALQNGELYQQLQKQLEYRAYVSRLIITINAGLSLKDTLINITTELNNLFTFDMVLFSLLDEHRFSIHNYLFNAQAKIEAELGNIPADQALVHKVAANDTLTLIGYLPDFPFFTEQTWLKGQHLQAMMVVLLKAGHSTIGSMAILRSDALAFNHNELEHLIEIGPALGVALDKARRLETIEQRNVDLEALNRLGEKLLLKTDVDFMLTTILEQLPILMPATVHGLLLTGDDTPQIGLNLPQNATPKTYQFVSQAVLSQFQNTFPSEVLNDTPEIHHFFNRPKMAPNWQPTTHYSWPILGRKQPLGLIYLGFEEQFSFTSDHIRLFSLIVSRISNSIDYAHLFNLNVQERARLSVILKSTEDGILVVDHEKNLLLDNPAVQHILNYKGHFHGHPLTDITANASLLTLFETVDETETYSGQFENAAHLTFVTSISPVKTEDGLLIGWVAIMKDITHLKDLDRAKDMFLSTASHDLRAPLNSISLATQFLQMTTNLPPNQAEKLAAISGQVTYMALLIDDLLDVSMIEANVDMEMSLQAINPILEEALDFYESQLEEKALQLTLNIPSTELNVLCNPRRLGQVLHNLIGNAIKYTPAEGQVRVQISLETPHLKFEIADSGFGIPQEEQAFIFDRFHRVKDENTASIPGTGLGLSIAKSIIEKHNGHIWVESQPGEGSRFFFTLPYPPQ